MKKYGPTFPDNSNFLMNYADAVGSLEYQLNPATIVQRSRTFSAELVRVGKLCFETLKDIAKSIVKNSCDSLVVKFEKPYAFTDEYQRRVEDILRTCKMTVKNSHKNEGSIILTYAIEPISSTVFNNLVEAVETHFEEPCGVGLACDGDEDSLNEDTDQYDIKFGK
jgi:hypothetical protein